MADVHHVEPQRRPRTVVTGAAGFIGSHLVDALLAQGHEVVGIDNFDPWYDPIRKRHNLSAALEHRSFEPVEMDITDAGLADVFVGADVVHHLAARAGVQDSWGRGFGVTSTANVLGTQCVLEAGLIAGVGRVVAASSSSVYGDHAIPGPGRRLAPLSPYGVSKVAAEQLADVYGARGLPVVRLRYFTVYGARQRPDMAFHRLFQAALPGNAVFTRRGSGEQRREFTHVSDVVDATIAAGTAPDAVGRAFDVGGGASESLNAVVAHVERLVGSRVRLLEVELPAGDPTITVADSDPAKRALSWEPSTSLLDGLEDQYRWHVSSGASAVRRLAG